MFPHKIGYNHTDRSTYSCDTVHQNLTYSFVYVSIFDMFGNEVYCSVEIDRYVKGLMINRRNVHVMIDDMFLVVEFIAFSAAQNSLDVKFFMKIAVLRRVLGL